jgi:hypothetical protein
MQLYPEIDPTNGISEMWHGEKWTKELTENELTPMWCDFTRPGAKHYYVREITEVDNGSFVLPLKWVVKEGAVHAESRKLHYSKTVSSFEDANDRLFNCALLGKSLLICRPWDFLHPCNIVAEKHSRSPVIK